LEWTATDVLIVVDVQNDFCPGGRLAVPAGDEIVAPVNRLAGKFANVGADAGLAPARPPVLCVEPSCRRPFETVALAYGAQVL
jgi:nicotinamidase/pyrazinamidase